MADFIFVLGRKNNGNESLIDYLKIKLKVSNISDFLSDNGDTEYFVKIYNSVCENLKDKNIEFLLMPDVEIDLLEEIKLKQRIKPLKTFKDYLETVDNNDNRLENLPVNQSA